MSRYRLLEPIGKGGMGEVFLAEDAELERKVALKFLPEALSSDESALERFRREAKSAAALDHPYICKVYEMGELEGRLFIAMEYVEGKTLRARLAHGALPLRAGLRAAEELAEALDKAHERNIVHRDLKPANVMLGRDGHVKIMDFGIARQAPESMGDESDTLARRDDLTGRGVVIGTPAYMSPEQLRGAPVDSRSDLFSLGIVLHEVLTGEHPFSRDSPAETAAAILREPPRWGARLPEAVRALLEALLSKEPSGRPASCRAVLEQLLEDHGVLEIHGTPEKPMVGREREMAELVRRLDLARAGRGSLVVIGGEPGVGKTRLSAEVLAVAKARGFLVLEGHCQDADTAQPFGPFVESLDRVSRALDRRRFREALGEEASEVATIMPELRRRYPDIPEPIELPPEQRRRYLFQSFRQFLLGLSQSTPIAWLLDDLHWADESSLALLQHLVEALDGMPVFIVGTYRDVELDVTKPLEESLARWVRQRLVHRLALKRLTPESVRDMLAALSGQEPPPSFVELMFARTEGNPFFVEEVYAHLREEEALFDDDGRFRPDVSAELEVPEGLRLVIGRRLDRLGEKTRNVLTLAAVVGKAFEHGLLEAVSDAGVDDVLDALEEAEAAGLVETVTAGRAARYRFTHELVRHTLLSRLSLPRRQRHHRRIADAMEKLYAGSLQSYASDLAHHFFQAGSSVELTKTLLCLKWAGDQALEATAFEEALRHYEHALEILGELDGGDAVQEAELWSKKGRALASLKRLDEGLEAWRRAIEIYDRGGDRNALMRICGELAVLLAWRGDVASLKAITERGLRAGGDALTASRCHLLAGAGIASVFSGEVDRGHAQLRSALADAESLGDGAVLATVLHTCAGAHWAGGGDWARLSQRAADALREADNLWEWVHAEGMARIARLVTGEIATDDQRIAEAEQLSKKLGNVIAEGSIRLSRGLRALLETASLPAFETFADWYRDFCERHGFPWKIFGHQWIGRARFWSGDWDGAMLSLRAAMAETPWQTQWGLLFLAKAYRRDPDSLEFFESHRSDLPLPGAPNFFFAWSNLFGAVEGLALLGEREKAFELYSLALQRIDEGVVVDYVTTDLSQKIAGIAATAGRDWEAAEKHFETALEEAERLPHRLQLPEVRRWYAAMLVERGASGDRDKARRLLGDAMEGYRSIGMPRHLEMAEALRTKI